MENNSKNLGGDKAFAPTQLDEQRNISVFSAHSRAEAFLTDRKSKFLSPSTISNYEKKYRNFLKFCEKASLQEIQELKASHIYNNIVWLESKDHFQDSSHAQFRVLRIGRAEHY